MYNTPIVASVASTALARGATVEELDLIWKTMKHWAPASTPGGFVADIDRAIAIVRQEVKDGQ
jgi:hypothetical protein